MRKQERHSWIQKLITENDVSKQEELVTLLLANNIPVTQATISRDIKEMKLIKVPTPDKTYKYSMPNEDKTDLVRLEKLLKSSFMDVKRMEKMVCLITIPGSGFALGGLIEIIYKEELFTVMSNDDKVLMFAKSEEQAIDVENKLLEIV
ncbi:MAG: arginine repressor [Vagococcus sp.]